MARIGKIKTKKKLVQGSNVKSRALARSIIIRALNDERFLARTISGLAKDTSLARTEVLASLRRDEVLRVQMKVLPQRTSDGKVLVTTKNHFSEKARFKDKFIDVFATKRITLDDID
jgi:hypothetical protein